MAILTDLPNELVREVVRGSDKKDLVGYGRISARFRTESQAELFYFPLLHPRNAARFLASLQSNLELSKLVKRFESTSSHGSIPVKTVSQLLCLVTELMTFRSYYMDFDCSWLLCLPKLHSLRLDHGKFNWRSTQSSPLSFPSIKTLSLDWTKFENIQSSQQLPLLFPSVTTLSIQCHSGYASIQPFGQHTKCLHLNSSNVDLESIKLLENLEMFHSFIPFTVLCDVLALLPSPVKQIRIEGYGAQEDWSPLVKLFESNLESFQQLETVYVESYSSAISAVVDLRVALEERKIRLEVLDEDITFEVWIKLVNRSHRN